MQVYFNNGRHVADAFESLLDSIYAAGEDHRQWQTVIAALADHLGGIGGALHAGRLDGTGFSFGSSYRVDPEALAAYADYYYSVNPLNSALSRIPVGVAVPDQQLATSRDLERSEFHDYARRFDIRGSMTVVVERDSHYEACLGVVRGLRSEVFSDEQVSFVQRLAPHIQRAIGLNQRLAALQNGQASLETALSCMETAVFVLARAGLIHYSNAAGDRIIQKRDGLTVCQGRLCAENPSAQNALARLVRTALAEKGARGGSVSVPRQHSMRPLLIKAMPIVHKSDFWLNSPEARAILFISDPDTRAGEAVDGAMDAFGLTPSEKKLLRELVAGRSLKEAAEALRITRATSRNKLARIMTKTDTHRQSELLQLILRSTPGSR